jgi:regulatory protein
MATKSHNPYYMAQAILSRRDHSEFEIRTKMKRKKFSALQINDVVTRLKKLDLINDNNFAETFTANTLHLKAVGRRWLAYKLKQKGIDQSIISDVLNRAYFPGREEKLARQAASTWRRTHSQHTNDYKRLTRHLISRGFSYDAINTAIQNPKP